MWYQLASAFLGYCLAAMFSSYVSLTFGLTVWGSAWTYFVLLFWWLIGYFALIPVIMAIFGGGALIAGGTLFGVAWLVDWVRGR